MQRIGVKKEAETKLELTEEKNQLRKERKTFKRTFSVENGTFGDVPKKTVLLRASIFSVHSLFFDRNPKPSFPKCPQNDISLVTVRFLTIESVE